MRYLAVPAILLAMVAAGCGNTSHGVVNDLSSDSILDHFGPASARHAPSGGASVQGWNPPVAQRPWRYIVVHHSATATGSAAAFDAMHRAKGWNGLGYDFVIDNGHGGPDGAVEVGPRWTRQEQGAHTGSTPQNEYNNYGIGICLVGDLTDQMPTPAQLASLNRLLRYLMDRYHIAPDNVIGHREAPNAATECPGNAFFTYFHDTLRPQLRRISATAVIATGGSSSPNRSVQIHN